MGAGASSQNRLRKALVIRAFNTRSENETIEEQFSRFVYKKNGVLYISLKDIKLALSLDAAWIDELFSRCMGGEVVKELEFKEFIQFLETGKTPCKKSDTILQSKSLRESTKTANTQADAVSELPVAQNIPLKKRNSADDLRRLSEPGPETTTLVVSKGDAIALSNKDSYRIPYPVKPLWRKREVVRQERTVHYTTMDAEGVLQELVEKETTQTEVLHMECRETGEFAHRETTSFEQLELFNNEVVVEERGTEEYVHLKSLDDEYEYTDNQMPQRAQTAPPASAAPEAGLESPLRDLETNPTDDPSHPCYQRANNQGLFSPTPNNHDSYEGGYGGYGRGDGDELLSPLHMPDYGKDTDVFDATNTDRQGHTNQSYSNRNTGHEGRHPYPSSGREPAIITDEEDAETVSNHQKSGLQYSFGEHWTTARSPDHQYDDELLASPIVDGRCKLTVSRDSTDSLPLHCTQDSGGGGEDNSPAARAFKSHVASAENSQDLGHNSQEPFLAGGRSTSRLFPPAEEPILLSSASRTSSFHDID